MKKIIALASGRGSNFRAIVESIQNGKIHATISLLICDRQAPVLDYAAAQGIPTCLLAYRDFSSKESFQHALFDTVNSYGPDLILTLGFMRILSPEFIKKYNYKIINIHPSLLPAFPGMHAQKQAFDYGVKVAGCTVHFADEGVDTGPIIMQKAVSVPANITPEQFSELILKEEHLILPESVRLFCEDKITIKDRKVTIHD